jgi:transposase
MICKGSRATGVSRSRSVRHRSAQRWTVRRPPGGRARGDREIGLARWQHDRVHRDMIYEWSVIVPLLPNKPRGVPRPDDRKILNGIFWRLRTGSPWADISERYGPYTTCYNRFVRWRKIGVWDRLFGAVSEKYEGRCLVVVNFVKMRSRIQRVAIRLRCAGGWGGGSVRETFSALDRVLGDTVAEGPVLFLDLDEVDEDVLPPKPDSRVKAIRDGLVECLFLLRVPPLIPGDLDDHEIIAAVDAQIIGIELEVVGLVLAYNLEAVVLGHADADERVIDGATDLLTVGRVPTLAKVDTNERHGCSPERQGGFRRQRSNTCICFIANDNGVTNFLPFTPIWSITEWPKS